MAKTVVSKRARSTSSKRTRSSRGARSTSWHSRVFRALDISHSPFKVAGLFVALGIVGFLLYAHAASVTAGSPTTSAVDSASSTLGIYMAPQTLTSCGKNPCWCPGQTQTDIVNHKADMQYTMRCMINYARKVKGVNEPLNVSTQLMNSSADKNRDIVFCKQFSHTACGRSQTYWFTADGYTTGVWFVGEDLGWGSNYTPRQIMWAWINSSEHRSIILNGTFRDIGDSVRLTSRLWSYPNVYTWVAHFGCHNSSSC